MHRNNDVNQVSMSSIEPAANYTAKNEIEADIDPKVNTNARQS
jgi:hypothetical protein